MMLLHHSYDKYLSRMIWKCDSLSVTIICRDVTGSFNACDGGLLILNRLPTNQLRSNR
jgi:hypothetical protein